MPNEAKSGCRVSNSLSAKVCKSWIVNIQPPKFIPVMPLFMAATKYATGSKGIVPCNILFDTFVFAFS